MQMLDLIKTFNTYEQFKYSLGGQIFSVEFIKKDGSLRKMVARLGVQKHVTGEGLKFDPIQKGLLPVFDMHKKAYRMININTIQSLKCGGKYYESGV